MTLLRMWLRFYRVQRHFGESRWRSLVDGLDDARWVLRCRAAVAQGQVWACFTPAGEIQPMPVDDLDDY